MALGYQALKIEMSEHLGLIKVMPRHGRTKKKKQSNTEKVDSHVAGIKRSRLDNRRVEIKEATNDERENRAGSVCVCTASP